MVCDRCDGEGSYMRLADCTTTGPDCACNGPRVDVDPCEVCGGSGELTPERAVSREALPWYERS
jgi:DnaJ-class molecular chaperone